MKLTKKAEKILTELGYSKQDFVVIEESINDIFYEYNGTKKISAKKAAKLLGQKDYLSGVARCVFHCTATRDTLDKTGYVFFGLSRIFKKMRCSVMEDIIKKMTEPILNTVLEDDDTPVGGISYMGETVQNFVVESGDLLHSRLKVSELNQHLIECGIKPIKNPYKCGGCCRCELRDMRPEETGYHCMMQDYQKDIFPEDEACFWYWDKKLQEILDQYEKEKDEEEREKRWRINAPKPPVKLPIVFDGYGNIPMCPTCYEMPYSTEQCYFCGQRFIQDQEVKEYSKPLPTERVTCVNCNRKTMVGTRSKYNGHFHGKCTNCGCMIME